MSYAVSAPPVGATRIGWLAALVPALAFLVVGSWWAFRAPQLPAPPAPPPKAVTAPKNVPQKPVPPRAGPLQKSPFGVGAQLRMPAASAGRSSASGVARGAVAPSPK
jgi:hypothetical protein